MATEQDTTETDAAIRPQTPAARRRNPAAAHNRTQADRERLREESRARRRARANGHVVAPEPRPDQITVRRLPEILETRPTPEAPSPRPSSLKPSTPAGGAVDEAPPQDAPTETLHESAAPQDASREAPATEALRQPAPPEATPPHDAAGEAPATEALRQPGRPEATPPRRALPSVPPFFRPGPPQPPKAPAPAAPPKPPAPAAHPPSPPAAPTQRDEPAAAPLPRLPRERAALLLGLASAVGIVIALAASLGSGSLPGFGGGLRAEASTRTVAPGGWLTLSGSDAPEGKNLVLESKTGDGDWHAFAHASSADDGRFAVRGRVLERPGQIEVRARVPGAATTSPIPVTVRPLRLASVGDINLGDVPGEAIAANGPAYPWQGTGKLLRSADLAFGNLECAVSTRGEPFPKQYNFRATPAALRGLRRGSGIDVLNLANNHVGDYGPEATTDTVRGVERLGMKAVGAGADLDRALQPQVVERLGLKVAFVGFSEIAPVEFAAAPGQPGTAWANPEQITAAVQAARSKADIVVATFHWGIEKQTLESAQQRELADVAVRAGAQVVIGAHPHTLQPVRRQGGAIVAYSLGNFVFGAQSPETTTTGILQLDLTAEGVTRASWRGARISGGRPVLDRQVPKRLPLRDGLAMQAGVNLPEL